MMREIFSVTMLATTLGRAIYAGAEMVNAEHRTHELDLANTSVRRVAGTLYKI